MKYTLTSSLRTLYFFLILTISSIFVDGQTFTHSGYIYGGNGVGVAGVPVYLYRRVTPALTGFTSQQNYNGHSYYRSTGTATWTGARDACAAMGGHLVTVTSAAENNFIYNLWPSGWIGLTDEAVEGQFRWITGEAYSYTSWNGGEPNNAGDEDYVQFVGAGRWNDLPNNQYLPYVLEFEYIVDYTTWELFATSTTDATGRYSFSASTNPSIEWYITFSVPGLPALTNTDGQEAAKYAAGISTIRSKDFYRFDVNNANRITVSDVYSIFAKRNGLLDSFQSTYPDVRIFTASQWSTLSSGTTDTRNTVPGVQSITINTPVSGGTSNFYLLRKGYNN